MLRLREREVQQIENTADLFPHVDQDLRKSVAKDMLEREGKGVLFILDGYDELPFSLRHKGLLLKLIKGEVFSKCFVLVTSRPSATKDLFMVCRPQIQRHVEILGFTQECVKDYASSIFSSEPDVLEDFLTYISASKNPAINSLMYVEDLAGEIEVDQIIENYLNALGGVEKLDQINDLTQIMSASMQGMELQITSIRKAPNMSMETVKAGEMEFQKQIFNGTSGIEIVQGQAKPLDDKRIQESMIESRIIPEMAYAQSGVIVTLAGLEKVGEEETYVLEIKQPSGKKSMSYFSKDTGLKLKESTTLETPQGSITQSVEYRDYQEINGIKFPKKALISMGPQKMDAEIVSIEMNTGVSDEVFKLE